MQKEKKKKRKRWLEKKTKSEQYALLSQRMINVMITCSRNKSSWCHLGPVMPPWSSLAGQLCSGVNALPGPWPARGLTLCTWPVGLLWQAQNPLLSPPEDCDTQPRNFQHDSEPQHWTESIYPAKKELKQSWHSNKAKVFRLIIFLYKTGHVSLGVQMPVLCTSLQHRVSDTRVMELLPITNAKRSDTNSFSNNICCTWTWRV